MHMIKNFNFKEMDELDRAAWKGFLIGIGIAVAVLSPVLFFFFKVMFLKFFYFNW